jgi:replicative DNA helicase
MYAMKSERSILLALLDHDRASAYICKRLADPNEFGFAPHRKIYQRYLYLLKAGKAPRGSLSFMEDPGLDDEARGALDVKDSVREQAARLGKADVKQFLETLTYYRRKRILHATCLKVGEELDSDQEIDIDALARTLQSGATKALNSDSVSSQTTLGARATLHRAEVLQAMKPNSNEILKTGIRVIDERIGGFARTNMVAISAPRGGGKSVLAKTLALSHFYQGQSVYVANLEMGKWEYLTRLFAETTDFLHAELRQGLPSLEDRKKVAKSLDEINAFGHAHNCRLTLDTVQDPKFTPEKMLQSLVNQGYDIVIVDYVNMFYGEHKDVWQNVYNASKFCKGIAKRLKCVVYLLTQLTDDDQAKYARALEEDADAWFMWRYVPGDPTVPIENKKGRSYDPFTASLVWDRTKTLFVDRRDLSAKEYLRIEAAAQAHAREVVAREQRMKVAQARLQNLMEHGVYADPKADATKKKVKRKKATHS